MATRMKLTNKHMQVCLDEGFARAWLETETSGCGENKETWVSLMADVDDAGNSTMIFRPNGQAWMLIGPLGMKSPKAITKGWSGGNRPVRTFKTVRQAARLAKGGCYY